MSADTPAENTRFFHPLGARLDGEPADDTLFEGVPQWMEPALRDWLDLFLQSDEKLSRNVVLELRWRLTRSSSYMSRIRAAEDEDLLDAVDAATQLHRYGKILDGRLVKGVNMANEPDHVRKLYRQLLELEEILSRSGSFLRLDLPTRRLVRRVEASSQLAFDRVREQAPDNAATLLESAWVHAYGRSPNPDQSYVESIKAVEAVINPLVIPNQKVPTLGMAMGDLRAQAKNDEWSLEIGDAVKQKENVERFIGMMELLWKNHESRHAGGPSARVQEQHEAEAVLHLAILIVQWVNTNVLKKV